MHLNRFLQALRLLLLVLVVGSILGAGNLMAHVSAYAVGAQPTWAFPFPTGTSVNIGPLGLHDHNFGSMKDDRTGKVFTFSNKLAPDSLDIVLQPPTTGTSTIPTTSVASGTVLAVWAPCQLVLVDHGNGWWGMYLHMANIKVVSGNTVKTGTIIGYPTTNKPTLTACGSVESTAEHVHFVLLNGSGTTGGYVSLLGKMLCGHTVVELNNNPTNIILQGLTQTAGQVFNVPVCGGLPPGTIKEFPLPNASSYPYGITKGPDGNLWFTDEGTNQIAKMTPSGSVTEFPIPTSKSNPWAITTGPDSNLWFIEEGTSKIGRITPSGTITEFSTPTSNSGLEGIASGSDGNLWFTESYVSKIGRITPSGTITEFSTPTSNSWPEGITTGPTGNLWFLEFGPSKVGMITPSGAFQEFSVPVASGDDGADYITSGPDGNLWFTDRGPDNCIWRMTPTGTFTKFPLSTSSSYTQGITSGPDGNLWFTESDISKIGRITPSGTITEFPIPTSGSRPQDITAGPDGNLWFTESGTDKIASITP